MSLFGTASKLFHSPDLTDNDDVITRDAAGEDPGYNALGPTAATALAGDTSDDDGQAIDDAFLPNPQGITGIDDTPLEADRIDDAPAVQTPRTTVQSPFGHKVELTDQDIPSDVADETGRIIRARIQVGSGFDPQMLLPRDQNRTRLVLIGDDDFQWSSDKSGCYDPGLFPAGLGIVLDGYTGALWAYNTSAASGSYVKCWAVTS